MRCFRLLLGVAGLDLIGGPARKSPAGGMPAFSVRQGTFLLPDNLAGPLPVVQSRPQGGRETTGALVGA